MTTLFYIILIVSLSLLWFVLLTFVEVLVITFVDYVYRFVARLIRRFKKRGK